MAFDAPERSAVGMQWFDWLIVIIPVAFVMYMGFYTKRFARGVADFLSAGRVARRYVICVADVANALSIIGLVAYVEVQYKVGFALTFWQGLILPVSMAMGLTGFCTYRFRETKAMSFGQFLEMRYSRSFRIFAAALRSLSEMLCNMIMPAIAGRFFIYFLDLPQKFTFCGITFDTFFMLMLFCLSFAVIIVCWGGTLALIVTDSIQGMIFYPLLATFVIFILCTFSWTKDIAPTMMDRIAGESFLNPFDIANLRDFNLFYFGVTLAAMVLHRASWIGAGNSSAAKSPHEQKMAGMLGLWRGDMVTIFNILIAVSIIVLLNGANFSTNADEIRTDISTKVASELVEDPVLRQQVIADVKALPPHHHVPGVDKPLSQANNLDTNYLNTVHKTLLQGKSENENPHANAVFQQFRSLFHQMMLAVSMRHLLPPGLMGLFCLLMMMAMISTDDTRLFSSALTITQDVIMPFRKTPLTPKQHIFVLRVISICVGVFFLIGSVYMSQLDYIQMFVALMTNLWLGGCAPVMLFGFYSRFGTTAGAFTSIISGLFLSLSGILVQRNWAETVYPWLHKMGWADNVGNFLETVSRPLNPIVVWKMDAVKFPINSYELYAMTMIITLTLYIVVSKLTCKEPFNLERMLHRGIYNLDGENKTREPWTLRNVFSKLIGITPEYSKGDRVIAWAFFLFSFIYKFLLAFLVVAVCNAFIFSWPSSWWSTYFLIVQLVIPAIVAFICTFWFGIGGAVNLYQLFRDLKTRVSNDLDNGMVDGHVSLADKRDFENAEKTAER